MYNYYNDLKYQVKFYYNLTKIGVSDSYKDYIESNLFKAFEYLEDSYYELFSGPCVPYQPSIKGYKSLQKIAHKAAFFSISKDAENFKALVKQTDPQQEVEVNNEGTIVFEKKITTAQQEGNNIKDITCFDNKIPINFSLSSIELKNLIIWQVLISKAPSSAICEEEFFDKIQKKFNEQVDYVAGLNKELRDYFLSYNIKDVSEFSDVINEYCPAKSDLSNGIVSEKNLICTIFQDFTEIFQDA